MTFRHTLIVMNSIEQFMTQSAHAVGHDQTLKFAHDRMQQFGLQHLPVLDGGVLVGVLSDRDIALISAVAPEQLETIAAEEAMSADPYSVAPTDDVAAVITHMTRHKQRSAVVMDHNKVVGLFTASDALALLSRLLEQREQGPLLGKLAKK